MHSVDPSSTRLRHSAQCQSLDPSFPSEALAHRSPQCWNLTLAAGGDLCTQQHTHGPPSSWAQKLALPQQECPSYPCLKHTCTNGLTINPKTAQTLEDDCNLLTLQESAHRPSGLSRIHHRYLTLKLSLYSLASPA